MKASKLIHTVSSVREWLSTYVRSRQTRALKNDERLEFVRTLYPDLEDAGEIAYLFVNKISTRPVCERCGSAVSWFGNRYAKTCSTKCANLLRDSMKTTQQIMKLKRQNDPNFESNRTSARLTTMKELYGSSVGPNHRSKDPATWELLNAKGRATLRDRYGVDNPSQLPDHVEKVKDANHARFGAGHRAHTEQGIASRLEKALKRISQLVPTNITVNEIILPDPSLKQANLRYRLSCDCGWSNVMPSETFKFRLRRTKAVCDICSNISSARSIMEKDFSDYISTLYEGPIVTNDRRIISSVSEQGVRTIRELDIVLPDVKIAFEFCGLYWHSTNDHTNSDDSKDRHSYKLKMATKNGYRLITIFEDEWVHKQQIVKRRLRRILGKTDGRVYARKCEVRCIEPSSAREFCERYHIQGYSAASVKLGLYNEEVLVAVMTFSRPTIAKGHRKKSNTEWELSRFCSSVSVVGGATKLFKYFVKHYTPTHVITYSDLRWNTGDVYLKMGFNFIGNSRNNYWYIDTKNCKRINRFAMRKTAQDRSDWSEFQNRAAQGYRWIYDCGNARYEWNK